MASKGYTRTQVLLHWAVVVLIAFQYLGSGGIEEAWRAFRRGEYTQDNLSGLAMAHIIAGVLVLVFALWRLVLRHRVGAPAAPASEPAALQILAKIVHVAIYALMFILPISGMAAWGGGVAGAMSVHLLAKTILLPLIGLHVAGALVHHFIWRTDVLRRMFVPVN